MLPIAQPALKTISLSARPVVRDSICQMEYATLAHPLTAILALLMLAPPSKHRLAKYRSAIIIRYTPRSVTQGAQCAQILIPLIALTACRDLL